MLTPCRNGSNAFVSILPKIPNLFFRIAKQEEVLLPNKNKWNVVASIPNFRFRFSAASHPASGKIYTFGGQDAFDSDCNCFPTSDTVVAYQVGGGSSPGVVVKGTASVVVSAVFGIALLIAGGM